MSKLQGKIAVITGGSSGMGLATAKLFVEEGATVVIFGRNQRSLDEAVSAVGSGIEAVQGDIAKIADLARLSDHMRERHGRVDIVFANAGSGILKPFAQLSEEDFDRNVAVNFKGTFFTVQSLLPLIPDGGTIVLNSSISGKTGLPGFTAYGAAKAAVRSLARTLTTDLKERRIRVNAISPGTFLTAAIEEAVGADNIASFAKVQADLTPLGRVGQVEEVARVVLFLGSADSSFVTGIDLTIDGGVTQV